MNAHAIRAAGITVPTILLTLICGSMAAFPQGQPASQVPAAQRPKVVIQSKAKSVLRGLSPQQARVFRTASIAKYSVFSSVPAGRIAAARFKRMDAVMLMPDLGRQRVVGLAVGGAAAGIAYSSGDTFSLVLMGLGKRAIGTVSMNRRGMLTISVDPNRDGIADYIEQWQGARAQASYIREGLGEDFLHALMAGKNAFCLDPDALKGSKGAGIPGLTRGDGSSKGAGKASVGDWGVGFDARAGLTMCSTGASLSKAGGGGWRNGSGGPQDPMALACAEFGERLSRPARFSPRIQSDDGPADVDTGPISDVVESLTNLVPDAGLAAAVGAMAKALVDTYGAQAVVAAMNSLGFPTAEALAEAGGLGAGIPTAEAAAAAVTTALSAVGVFLAITLTPSHAAAADCETSRAGCNTPDAGSTSSGGTPSRSRPGPEGSDESFRSFCARRQDQRQEWQHVVEDQRERNFTECVNPTSGESTADRSAFCRFLAASLKPEQGNASIALQDENGRGPIDSPQDRMQQRLSEARRMAGDIRVVTCDPLLCQPPP